MLCTIRKHFNLLIYPLRKSTYKLFENLILFSIFLIFLVFQMNRVKRAMNMLFFFCKILKLTFSSRCIYYHDSIQNIFAIRTYIIFAWFKIKLLIEWFIQPEHKLSWLDSIQNADGIFARNNIDVTISNLWWCLCSATPWV